MKGKDMAITFRHVSFGYTPEKKIFQDLNLSLPDSGFITILGQSGSGKTTLLNLLLGNLKPEEGEITSSQSTPPAIVFQSPLLLDYLTIKENVALPLLLDGKSMKESSSSVETILKELNIFDYKDKKPYLLSGGEQVRVSIARALIKGNQTLILDEPTGQLDEENSDKIFELLKKLSKDHLILLVTHDEIKGTRYADYLYRLENQSLKLLSSPKETLTGASSCQKELSSSSFTLRNALYLNKRYLSHRKPRVILSVVFLAFNMLLIYLGMNLHSHLGESINSLLEEYYTSDVFSLSMKKDVASAGNLHLTKNSLPNEEVLSILKLRDTYYSQRYFLPQVNEIQVGKKVIDTSFYPVIKEDRKKLSCGHHMTSLEEVIVNESFLIEAGLDKKTALHQSFAISHHALVYSNQFESSDMVDIHLTFRIVGIAKEKTAFNQAIVYYSYADFNDFLKDQSLNKISEELGEDKTAYDLLFDSDYDDDDFKSNELLCIHRSPYQVKENGNRIFPQQLTFSSPSLTVKESTKEIFSSLLEVLTVFLVLNTVSAISLEFLVIYSLYEDNLRLFALIKVYRNRKRDNLKNALGLEGIFVGLTFFLTLSLSLISASAINLALAYFRYPAFLAAFDMADFFLVTLLLVFSSLLAALLPLRKIKPSQINKELEGED